MRGLAPSIQEKIWMKKYIQNPLIYAKYLTHANNNDMREIRK